MLLMVNNRRFRVKPNADIVKSISIDMDVRYLTMVQICRAIEHGQTIRPGVFDRNDIHKDSWKCSLLGIKGITGYHQ
ncbi:MAG TPA: hypothetical protein GXX54_03150 [Clostridiales bacterium]|nr:hypothetical protein [Clostridiales bacterium]